VENSSADAQPRYYIVRVMPDITDPVSEGKPCIKGLTIHEVVDKGRVLKPMLRKEKGDKLKAASWQDAYRFIYDRLSSPKHGDIFVSPSGKTTNEDCYTLQKFARIVLGTNNVDGCCTRLCHKATLVAMRDCFDARALPGKIDDILGLDCLLIAGSNPASNYPVQFNRIARARKRGMRVISIQTIATPICEYCDINLIIKPGTEVLLFNGLMNGLISRGMRRPELKGFDELAKVASMYPIEEVCLECGLSEEKFREALEAIADAKALGVVHGMGLTQHCNGVANVHALLSLLMLKHGRLLSLRGEVNVQGVGDVGGLPNLGDLLDTELLGQKWQCELPKARGKTVIEAFITAPVKAAIISDFNPAQSLPDLDRVHANMEKMFIVQLGSHFNLTSEFADVVLPTPMLIEHEGTITNGERRVRFVRKVAGPQGEAKSVWLICKELSAFWKKVEHFNYPKALDITREIVHVIPDYHEIDVDMLYDGNDQWPSKHIRHERFVPERWQQCGAVASRAYPFVLTTFRSPHRFLTDDVTRHSETLVRFGDKAACHINSGDAKRLGIRDGSRVNVTSATSHLVVPAKLDAAMPRGVVGMQFHFREALVNKLFPCDIDPASGTPNYKIVAVRIEKAK
jgi:anaerobic selenocysteine-containing dehydrogenase